MKIKTKSLVERDEDLVLACQKGVDFAWEKLTQRYLYRAMVLANLVYPELASLLQQSDLEECMLMSIMNAVYAFRPGGATFFRFLLVVYRNEISKALAANKTFSELNVVSLSDTIPGTEDTLTFEDVIADEKENPTSFYDSLVASKGVKDVADMLDDLTKEVVMLKLQGKRFQEIADELNISYKIARSRYLKYKDLINKKMADKTSK